MADVKLTIPIVAEFQGTKAFKQAEDSTTKLAKSVKKLASAFGLTFSAQQIVRFSQQSIKAFAADDKAAQVLTRSLTNLGLAFEDLNVKNFISQLQTQTGVLDDQLRPAFQKLLTTTGSVVEAQKILRTALDLSAASGVDLETVSTDLSKAYVGQTRGLAKYGLGLSQAELKGMKYADVQERINKLFGGAAATVADSYAGKLAKVNVQFKNFQEATGKALLDGLDNLSGQKGGGVSWLQRRFDALSDSVSRTVDNFSRFAGAVGLGLQGKGAAAYDLLNQLQVGSRRETYKGATPAIQAELAKKVYEDRMKAIREEQLAADKLKKTKQQQLALEKAQASLAKAQANFDITKINLAAALKGKVSEDEKNRLMALQAIENGNGEEALKWIAKIDAARAQAVKDEEARQAALHDSIMARLAILNAAIQAKQAALLMLGMGGSAAAAVSSGNSSYIPNMGAGQADFGAAAYQVPTNPYGSSYYGATGRDPMPITVVLDSNVVGNAVRDVFLGNSLSGSQSSIDRAVSTYA